MVIDALGVIAKRKDIVLTGYWSKITWFIIKYLYNNNRGEYVADFSFHPKDLHIRTSGYSWILSACNTDSCPDDALRLELFGLIWTKNYVDELSIKEMVDFFVRTISELDCDVIYNNHGQNLIYSADDLCVCFDRFDQLDQVLQVEELTAIGEKIIDSLTCGEYSREVKFLQNLFKLTGIFSKIARFRFEFKSRLLRKLLNDCLLLFIHKFTMFFKDGMEKFSQLCIHPFIYPYYIDLVDNITSGILDLSGKLNKWRENKKLTKARQEKFRLLETRRNYMVYCVNSMKPPLNLPPFLGKRELGMLKPSGRAQLQKQILNQPNLPLSFNYSNDRVNFRNYIDEPIDYEFLNLNDANDEEESDNGESLFGSDDSADYDSDESTDNVNFQNERTIGHFIRNVFRNLTNQMALNRRRRVSDTESVSDDGTNSNASENDDNTNRSIHGMVERTLNEMQNNARLNRRIHRVMYGNEVARNVIDLRDNPMRTNNVDQDSPDSPDNSESGESLHDEDGDCIMQ